MNNITTAVKNSEKELPIPTEWRPILFDIVEAFKNGDFRLKTQSDCIHPLSPEDAKRISENVADYGDLLTSLPEQTWNSSIYRWMGNHWELLVDLFTINEGASDLVMFLKVKEHSGGYCFIVHSVHVP